MNKQLAIVSILATALLAGCTKHEPMDVNKPLPAESLGKQWSFDLKWSGHKDSIRSLHLRDETLYVYSDHNTVAALTSAAGKILWSADIHPNETHLKPPVVLADKVVFPAAASLEIYNFSGKKMTSIPLGHTVRSGAIGLGKMVYVGLDYPAGGRIAAVDVTRAYGFTQWEKMTFGGLSATPAMFQAVIYVGAEDRNVYAMTEDGKPVWGLLPRYGFRTDGRIIADVKVDETGVYVASTDSKLYCIERGGGKLRWQYYAGVALREAPIVSATMVFQTVPGRGVAALDKIEGSYDRQPKWICPNATMYLSEDEKYVYLRGTEDQILAVDKSTGKVQFKSQRDDFVAFAQNQKDSTIYAATEAGYVMAIKPVLKPGTVGTMVLAPIPVTEALAAR